MWKTGNNISSIVFSFSIGFMFGNIFIERYYMHHKLGGGGGVSWQKNTYEFYAREGLAQKRTYVYKRRGGSKAQLWASYVLHGSSLMATLTHFFPIIVQKLKFSMKDFFSKCDQIRSHLFGHIYWFTYLVTFTEEILHGKLQFFCSECFLSILPEIIRNL